MNEKSIALRLMIHQFRLFYKHCNTRKMLIKYLKIISEIGSKMRRNDQENTKKSSAK